MKAVIIGGSGHFEYATACGELSGGIAAYAPGSPDEDLTMLEEALPPQLKKYGDYKQMLEQEKPDVAVVNPHYHLISSVVQYCLEKHIHCFAEKPLALTEAALDNLEAMDGNARIGMMMIHRYQPAFYAAHKAVVDGRIGDLHLLTVRKSYKMGEKPAWMRSKKKFGGIIPWVGAHAIDLLCWMGFTAVSELYAKTILAGNRGMGEVESAAVICLTNGSGQLAEINLDYQRPESAGTHGDDYMRLVGEDGIIEVHQGNAYILSEDEDASLLPTVTCPQIFGDFVQSLKGTGTYRVPENDAFYTARVCLAAERSAITNEIVKF